MDISVRSVSNGVYADNNERWVKVNSRAEGLSVVGKICGQVQMKEGLFYQVWFPADGDAVLYHHASVTDAEPPSR